MIKLKVNNCSKRDYLIILIEAKKVSYIHKGYQVVVSLVKVLHWLHMWKQDKILYNCHNKIVKQTEKLAKIRKELRRLLLFMIPLKMDLKIKAIKDRFICPIRRCSLNHKKIHFRQNILNRKSLIRKVYWTHLQVT